MCADTEDLVQDVLLSVHSVLATYEPSLAFTPWLLAIVRNGLADAARRYGRRHAHELQVDDLQVTFARPRRIPSMRALEALSHAIRALPAGQRQAIVSRRAPCCGTFDASASVASFASVVSAADRRVLGVSLVPGNGGDGRTPLGLHHRRAARPASSFAASSGRGGHLRFIAPVTLAHRRSTSRAGSPKGSTPSPIDTHNRGQLPAAKTCV
jgi:hypothetical protein